MGPATQRTAAPDPLVTGDRGWYFSFPPGFFFTSMGMHSRILSGNPSTPLRLLCGAPASVGKTFLRAYPDFPLRHKPLQTYDCDAVVEEGGGDAQQGDPCRVGDPVGDPTLWRSIVLANQRLRRVAVPACSRFMTTSSKESVILANLPGW